ncbi:MAG: hypothetical protein Q7S74_01700 [Nanoarchaeota archaeon]|nr:hypothetical protein [Nanoarchaeota archaeon]
MKRGLIVLAVIAIVALFISFITAFLGFRVISYLSLILLLIAEVSIFLGFVFISRDINNKLMGFSAYGLIILSILLAIFSFISAYGGLRIISVLGLIINLINNIFFILLGISLIKSKRDKTMEGIALVTGIIFIVQAALSFLLSGYLFILMMGSAGFNYILNDNPLLSRPPISLLYFIPLIFSIILFFNKAKENTDEQENNSDGEQGSVSKGYSTSLIIAFVVAVLGAIFEAATGFVTLTLMPDIVFLIANLIFLLREKRKKTREGIGIGFINLVIVIIVSVIVFLIAVWVLQSLGWYEICKGCNANIF